jgi:hypothetical protein
MKRTKQCCIGLGADIDWKKKERKKKNAIYRHTAINHLSTL